MAGVWTSRPCIPVLSSQQRYPPEFRESNQKNVKCDEIMLVEFPAGREYHFTPIKVAHNEYTFSELVDNANCMSLAALRGPFSLIAKLSWVHRPIRWRGNQEIVSILSLVNVRWKQTHMTNRIDSLDDIDLLDKKVFCHSSRERSLVVRIWLMMEYC